MLNVDRYAMSVEQGQERAYNICLTVSAMLGMEPNCHAPILGVLHMVDHILA